MTGDQCCVLRGLRHSSWSDAEPGLALLEIHVQGRREEPQHVWSAVITGGPTGSSKNKVRTCHNCWILCGCVLLLLSYLQIQCLG